MLHDSILMAPGIPPLLPDGLTRRLSSCPLCRKSPVIGAIIATMFPQSQLMTFERKKTLMFGVLENKTLMFGIEKIYLF
jgi:hypothetical protein